MSRSLKKGPYINYKLEKKVLDASDSKKKSCHQDLVKGFNDFSGFCRADHRSLQWK